MDPRPQELATESMVSEYQGAPLTHNERVAREVSNRANNEEWRQGLALLTEQKEKADMKTSEVATLIGRFGTDVEVGKSEDFKPEDDDDQGRLELTTEETDLQRRANEADQLLVAINEKGFDGLNVGEQRRAREMARDALGKHKGLSERFYALPAREQQQYLSDLLRNPQASAEMIKLYNEIGEGRALSNEGIFTAMEQYEKVMTEDKILSEQVAEVQRRYSQVEIRLSEFNVGGDKRNQIEAYQAQYQRIRQKLLNLTSEYNRSLIYSDR